LDYDLVSNEALQQTWLVNFKEAQNKTSNVKMKNLLCHGKWEIPWPFSLIDSLNIIDCYAIEANEDDSEIANDVMHLSYVSHGSYSKVEDALIDEVDILVRTYVLDIEQQNELIGCTSYLKHCKNYEPWDISNY
jgi:hypothetical protein